jgi:hypothetical protein
MEPIHILQTEKVVPQTQTIYFNPNVAEIEQSASDASPNPQPINPSSNKKQLDQLIQKYIEPNESYFTTTNVLIGLGIILVLILIVAGLKKKNKRR